MTLFKEKYRIESARLRNWDYSGNGGYFVTICTRNREHLLGTITDDVVQLSPAGEIVAEEWQKTAEIRQNIALDAWVIMPNHLHGIIIIDIDNVETPRWGVLNGPHQPETFNRETFQRNVSTEAKGLKADSLGAIVGQFKAAVTKRCLKAGLDFAWQTRFYDHVIRDEDSFNDIRKYIAENPLRWAMDKDNQANLRM